MQPGANAKTRADINGCPAIGAMHGGYASRDDDIFSDYWQRLSWPDARGIGHMPHHQKGTVKFELPHASRVPIGPGMPRRPGHDEMSSESGCRLRRNLPFEQKPLVESRVDGGADLGQVKSLEMQWGMPHSPRSSALGKC
jgi:hypothetical protein